MYISWEDNPVHTKGSDEDYNDNIYSIVSNCTLNYDKIPWCVCPSSRGPFKQTANTTRIPLASSARTPAAPRRAMSSTPRRARACAKQRTPALVLTSGTTTCAAASARRVPILVQATSSGTTRRAPALAPTTARHPWPKAARPTTSGTRRRVLALAPTKTPRPCAGTATGSGSRRPLIAAATVPLQLPATTTARPTVGATSSGTTRLVTAHARRLMWPTAVRATKCGSTTVTQAFAAAPARRALRRTTSAPTPTTSGMPLWKPVTATVLRRLRHHLLARATSSGIPASASASARPRRLAASIRAVLARAISCGTPARANANAPTTIHVRHSRLSARRTSAMDRRTSPISSRSVLMGAGTLIRRPLG